MIRILIMMMVLFVACKKETPLPDPVKEKVYNVTFTSYSISNRYCMVVNDTINPSGHYIYIDANTFSITLPLYEKQLDHNAVLFNILMLPNDSLFLKAETNGTSTEKGFGWNCNCTTQLLLPLQTLK